MGKMKAIMMGTCVCLLLLMLQVACQDLYTTGIFGSLQDDPKDLSDERLIDYGWDALGTGENSKIEKAFEALEDALKDSPKNAEMNYVAAFCALELSGVTEVIISQPSDYTAFKNSLDTACLIDAGTYFDAAAVNGADLNAIDSFFCGTGILLNATGGDFSLIPFVFAAPSTPEEIAGVAYATAGLTAINNVNAELGLTLMECFLTP
ncbi:MAG: hypothetical protein JW881_11915 [Spirochaetales bacterium]|nr:hypothetical protein [Spirochaetales bacterium]